MLAETGDDRDRFSDARALKAYAGSAPITRASGKKHQVGRRRGGHRKGTDRLYTHGIAWADWDACESYGRDLVTGASASVVEYRCLNPAGTAMLKAAEYLPARGTEQRLPLPADDWTHDLPLPHPYEDRSRPAAECREACCLFRSTAGAVVVQPVRLRRISRLIQTGCGPVRLCSGGGGFFTQPGGVVLVLAQIREWPQTTAAFRAGGSGLRPWPRERSPLRHFLPVRMPTPTIRHASLLP